MAEKYDVLVVGDASLDVIYANLPRLPVLHEDTLAEGFDMLPGEAYTAAAAMHRLGLKVAWAADWGNDLISKIILDFVRAEGMDERFFVHHNRPYRRISSAASVGPDRGFMTYYDPEPTVPAGVAALAKVNARAVFIPGMLYGKMFDMAVPVIKMKKMILMMDGNCSPDSRITEKPLQRALKQTDIFLPNAQEARSLTQKEDLADAIRALGELCPLVVVKNGPDGSYACVEGEITHVPVTPVKPLDTTGAGDCYDAGFLKAYLDGKPVAECLAWGNIIASYSVRGYGGTGTRVTVEMIEKELSNKPTPN